MEYQSTRLGSDVQAGSWGVPEWSQEVSGKEKGPSKVAGGLGAHGWEGGNKTRSWPDCLEVEANMLVNCFIPILSVASIPQKAVQFCDLPHLEGLLLEW